MTFQKSPLTAMKSDAYFLSTEYTIFDVIERGVMISGSDEGTEVMVMDSVYRFVRLKVLNGIAQEVIAGPFFPDHRRQPIRAPWDQYPLGTKAIAFSGGYWIKVPSGWKWFNGDTIPTPGAEARWVELPDAETKQQSP